MDGWKRVVWGGGSSERDAGHARENDKDGDAKTGVFVYGLYIYMETTYDRENINKLFEVIRGYEEPDNLVDLIMRIYDGSLVKFDLESIVTGWCKIDSGVR